MKRYLTLFLLVTLVACKGRNTAANMTNNDHNDAVSSNHSSEQNDEEPQGSLDRNCVSFFGELIVLDDSAHIMQQIEEIAAKGSMLSVEGRVLNVGDVGFGINFQGSNVLLISSIPVDDPKIEQVVDYLSNIYGLPEEQEPNHYWWQIRGDCHNPGGLARLRSLRGSENGGTVLIFSHY